MWGSIAALDFQCISGREKGIYKIYKQFHMSDNQMIIIYSDILEDNSYFDICRIFIVITYLPTCIVYTYT